MRDFDTDLDRGANKISDLERSEAVQISEEGYIYIGRMYMERCAFKQCFSGVDS